MTNILNFTNNTSLLNDRGRTGYRCTEITGKASTDQILQASNLDWLVNESPVQYQHRHQLITDKTNKVLHRSDDGSVLGIFKQGYRAVQNREILDFFTDYAGYHNATIDRVGYADNGCKVFAEATFDNFNTSIRKDANARKLLLIDSRDGSIAFTAQPFLERLICTNQLRALSDEFGHVKQRHTSSLSLQKIALDLGIVNDVFSSMEHKLTIMANTSITAKEACSVIYSLHATKNNIDDEATRTLNKVKDIHQKFVSSGIGMNTQACAGTMYGVLNAVTEYYDHDAGRDLNSRFKSSNFGIGAKTKDNTYNTLVNLLSQDTIPLVDGIEQVYLRTA